MMPLPDEIIALLRGFPDVGAREQAFPFLSVDANGFPHSALLSRSELEPGTDGTTLLSVMASNRTRVNLQRSRSAALIAVDGSVCHHIKLQLVASVDDGDLLGCVFAMVAHKRDDIGIPMKPLTFRASTELAAQEDWQRGAAMFARLQTIRADQEAQR
ncbi:hypothetical protein ACIHDR_40935 [Nocardia sp. NPDC052278]|uniref:hypothetical protein n=1 Tax=unclassified Nocardia TaxID=2637762 RepID=UPI0036B0E5A4